MDNLLFSLNATLPVFLLMMIGWGFRRTGIISGRFASDMNTFVFKIALPVSLFTELYNVDFFEVWDTRFVVFCFLATLASAAIAWGMAKLLKDRGQRGEFIQGAYRSSASLLGMAYIELLYGHVTYGSLMMIGCVPLYNVLAVIVLTMPEESGERNPGGGSGNRTSGRGDAVSGSGIPGMDIGGGQSSAGGNGGSGSSGVIVNGVIVNGVNSSAARGSGSGKGRRIRRLLIGIVTNPIILGIMIGFAWALLRIPMPEFASTTLNFIGRTATPLGLLAMGASLDFGKMFHDIRPALAASFLKLVGFAAIFIPIAAALGFRGEKLAAVLIMLGSASTVAGYVMAKNMGHEGTLSASVVMITTFFCSFTLTLWITLLRGMGLL